MSKHPEFEKHQTHGKQAEAYRRVVALWQESDEPLPDGDGRAWTVERAQGTLEALVDLFNAYNRVLWRHFPYCSQCLGGCCVVDAADLKGIDYVALALMEEQLPRRPARSPVGERACIYLTPQGCSWPAAWRPIKCAAFYCLGSGEWRLDAADARYEEITGALRRAVGKHLPAVERYVAMDEQTLLDLLPDPVAFADALAGRLDETLLAAIHARYPSLLPEETREVSAEQDPTAAALAFIAEAVEEVYAGPPPAPDGRPLSAEQLLEDLETLQWVLLGGPVGDQPLLEEMAERYAAVPPPCGSEAPSVWYRMQRHVEALRSAHREERPSKATKEN
ncbi:MAG: hypothetical protein R3248_09305 [Candidatus Promineifilaceae bacterium]|nr:hypothetical protein [Candidatus Promineifilaceae bacterium]